MVREGFDNIYFVKVWSLIGVKHNAHNEKNWSNAHYRTILTLVHTQVSIREKLLFHVNISLPTVDPQLEICP